MDYWIDGWGLRVDSGAEPPHVRCLAERCELRQLAVQERCEPNVGLAMRRRVVWVKRGCAVCPKPQRG
jgi:hypothetical protein